MGADQSGGPLQIAITVAVVLLVITIRILRSGKQRPLRLGALWIIPLVILVMAAMMLWQNPPHGVTIAAMCAALAAGAAIGWHRGAMMRITVDPVTHSIQQSASPAALIFLLVLFAVRFGIREFAALEGAAWHIDANAVTDVLIAFAFGMLSMQRVEMFLRARRLLDEARAVPHR